MSVFDVISLLGGLAMFLYGMKLMGNSLKEGSSGTLKVVMEKVTNSILKAFFLGVFVTAIIQSSTATIVITSGLVAAGIISLKQSLGIIIGANVGTTVTGQIIRLLDVNSEGTSWLEFFKPSTLAPLALIAGVVLIMFLKFNKSNNIGSVCVGFGILFSGLMNMTESVKVLTQSGGFIDHLFGSLGSNPLLGYATGAGVAFVLQSSSATIGILQAFSMAGEIPFGTIYIILVGVYLGDCVTTAIVCAIGAKSDAKRVGIVNILFNLSETVIVVVVVTILHKFGVLDSLWTKNLTPGGIANTNTVFNLGCAILMLPFVGVLEKLSRKLVKDEAVTETVEPDKYGAKIDALNKVFFSTPALALRSCYDILNTMLHAACDNIQNALSLLFEYDEEKAKEIDAEEHSIDRMTDAVSNYMLQLSPFLKEDLHIKILDQYYKDVSAFERLGDHAVNICEVASNLNRDNQKFSEDAKKELRVIFALLDNILDNTKPAFEKRNVEAARHIEPLEEVMDDMINMLHDNHLVRLRDGNCTMKLGIEFVNVLTNLERISDICSGIGVATIARATPGAANLAHSYISSLHQGKDENYNKEYQEAHDVYFTKLEKEM